MRFRNVCSVILWVIFVCCGNLFAGVYSGGLGTPGNPYIIADADDLLEIGSTPADFDSNFIMTANIDMSGVANNVFIPIGYYATTSLTSAVPFTGSFNGQGFSVSNLSITSNKPGIGLFGIVNASDAVIENVTVINPIFTTTSSSGRTGGLVGFFDGDRIANCHVINPSITGGPNTGGLVGTTWSVNSPSISNCSVIGGSVAGANRVGGLAGYIASNDNYVSRCQSSANVSSYGTSAATSIEVGGFAGGANFDGTTISQCFAAGNVTGSPYSDSVGGFVGRNNANIYNSFASGNVSGRASVGGFQGYHGHNGSPTLVQYCYSTGKPTGTSKVGGFTGEMFTYWTTCSDCYWDSDTSETVTSAAGLPRSTAQMQQAATYSGWGFPAEWLMPAADYPKLRSFYSIADFNADDMVDFMDFSGISTAWNTQQGNPGYDPLYDIHLPLNGIIDIDDFMVLVLNWLTE